MTTETSFQGKIDESLASADNLAGLAEGLVHPDAYESFTHPHAPSAALISALLAINETLTALVLAVQEGTLGTYEASGRY